MKPAPGTPDDPPAAGQFAAGGIGGRAQSRGRQPQRPPAQDAREQPPQGQKPGRGYHAIADLFGYRVVAFGDGRCVAEWTPGPPFVNSAGGVWGGAVSAIVDNICAMAVAAAIDPPPRHLPTVSMHVDFLQPLAVGGTYQLNGHALRVGKRLAVADTHIVDSAGTLLARATCTYSVRR